jgi:hypothetical protein
MKRLKYDYEMLKNICDEGGVTLLVDYSDKYVTRDTRVIGKCILCENSFDKSLNKLHKQRNFGCETCAKKFKFERIKTTMVDKYGVEYAAQSQTFIDKMKNTSLEKYGVENANQNELVKEKIRQTNLVRYGCEYGLQNEEVKEKRKNTNLEKYGFENPLQREEIKEKIKGTNLEKYGVEYASQCSEFKEKRKETNLEKYGVEHFTQTDTMKEKTKKTNMERYGVENILQCEEIKEKIKETNLDKYGRKFYSQTKECKEKIKKTSLEKYGVEHPSQNKEIMEKINKNIYKSKEYILPSGNIIKIQGYEYYALDELLQKENINENDIITGCSNVPTIWYIDENGKKHRHYVDIFIPSQNRCIEVKSLWTFQKQKNIVFLKQNAAKELGYLYEIWIYDNKGNKI